MIEVVPIGEAGQLQSAIEELTKQVQGLRDDKRVVSVTEEEIGHDHYWEVSGFNIPPENIQPQHPRSILSLTQVHTYVLLRCVHCRWLCSLQLIGNYTEDQLKGEVDGNDGTTAS
jgi:hypothetical protein